MLCIYILVNCCLQTTKLHYLAPTWKLNTCTGKGILTIQTGVVRGKLSLDISRTTCRPAAELSKPRGGPMLYGCLLLRRVPFLLLLSPPLLMSADKAQLSAVLPQSVAKRYCFFIYWSTLFSDDVWPHWSQQLSKPDFVFPVIFIKKKRLTSILLVQWIQLCSQR